MAGQYDIVNTVGGDFTPISQQYANFARSLPPIKARIDVTGLGTISRQASDFEKSLGAAQSRVTAFGLAAGSVYAVARAFEELVKSTVDVQKDLASINVVLGLSSNGLAKFSTSLFSVANLTAQSFKAVADVALQFSRQGLGAEEVLKRTADAMTLVRIGGTDTETAVKALTATLNTFNEVGLDSTAILNKIATVDTKFAVSGNVIAEALTRVSSTAKEAGVSFDSLIGITTALQQITSRGGSVIGNSLKSIFQRIQRPEVIEQLNEMGIATEDLNGKLLGSDVILRNVAKSYSTLSQAQQAQITQISAGLFQANQFKAIIGDLAKTNGIAARATDTASQSTDQATRRQAALNQTLASQLQVSLNNLTQFAAKAGEISIAPALNNIFKGINLVTDSGEGNGIGEKLGEGVLKGLGNFISGPGLATAGVLAAKFFGQFSTYAAKSLSQILETSFTRYEQEKAINSLLEKQPQIMQEIAALGNDEAAAQAVVLKYLNQQNVALNEKAQISKLIAASTTGLSPNTFFPTGGKSFAVSESSDGPQITKNPKFAGSFSAISASLSEAIEREKAMGVNPSSIKIGTSGLLVSADNPLGMAVYNTRDEPLGLEQGIQRNVRAGLDPKRAGVVPNFADNPFPFLPSRFSQSSFYPKAEASFDIRNLAPDSVRYGKPPEPQQFPLLLGAGSGKNAIQLPELTDSTKALNAEMENLNKKFRELISNTPKLLGNGGPGNYSVFARTDIGPSREQYSRQIRELTNPKGSYPSPYYENAGIPGEQLQSASYIKSQEALAKQRQLVAEEQQRQTIASFEKRAGSLGLGSYFTSVLPNSEFKKVKAESETLGQTATFRGAQDRLVSQALISSFIAPLIAGQIQNLIPNTSTTSRGIGAGVGALGNIASYAAIGGTIAPGPAGIIGGAAVGGLLEIPTVLKAFSDILPDLQKNLDYVKDSTTKVNDAFSGLLNAQQEIDDVNNGRTTVKRGQYKELQNRQAKFLNALPPSAQEEVRAAISAGKSEDVYQIASRYNTAGQQKQSGIEDVMDLIKNPLKQFASQSPSDVRLSSSLAGIMGPGFNTAPSDSDIRKIISDSDLNRRGEVETRVNPTISNILGYENKDGTSIQDILASLTDEEKKFSLTKSSFEIGKDGNLKSRGLSNLLDAKNVDSKVIDNIISLVTALSKAGYSSELTKGFSQEQIDKNKKLQDEYNNGIKTEIEQKIDLSVQLSNLARTGAASVNAFEINVVNKLSNALAKLKIQNLSNETDLKISALGQGKNSYSAGRNSFLSEIGQSNLKEQSEIKSAKSDFSTEVSHEFTSIANNFIKGLVNSKNKGADVEKLAQEKIDDTNKVFAGIFNISESGGKYSANLNQNLSPNDIQKAQTAISGRIGELGIAKGRPNAKTTDIKSEIDYLTNLSEKLDDITDKYDKRVAGASAERGSANSVSSATLEQLFRFLPKQSDSENFISERNSRIGRQFTQKAFDLGEIRDISGRESAVELSSQISALPQQKQIIDTLNTSLGPNSNYGVDAAISPGILQSALISARAKGDVEAIDALKIALTELGNVTKDTTQKTNIGVSQISTFSDDLSKSVENQNIQIAKNGNISGGNYAAAFLAPLQYNNNDFQKDTVTATQQFAQELKSDLSDSLLSITKNAKSASEAFRDLGLALAESLAKKAIDIGISQLFGLVTSGAGSILSRYKSGGGYIPKFASGGMVNMGSGMADDVPAFLSGGEFVINKNAVKRIGKNNLDLLNQTPHFASGGAFIQPLNYSQSSLAHPNDFAGVTSDSVTGSSSAANVSLSNAYLFNPGLFTGKSAVSPLLSGIGASSALDPQNKLRLSREKYALNTRLSYYDFQNQLDQYNTQQEMALGEAYLGAAGSVAGAFASSKGGASSAQMSEFMDGKGPVSASAANADYQSLMNIQTGKLYSGGGSIPRFASGGYFGGDSGSDSFKAMVMGGEYVMNPKSVSKYGTNFFKSLNDTAKYAGGGAVGQSMYNNSGDGSDRIVDALSQIRDRLSSSSGSSNVSTAGSSAQTNHVTINVSMAANGSTSSQSSSSSVGSDSKDKSTQSQSTDAMNKLAGNIKGLIVKEITQQSRPGGILHQAFVKKP